MRYTTLKHSLVVVWVKALLDAAKIFLLYKYQLC